MSASERGIVIVGAGQGGMQAACSLREGGYDGPLTLIGNEAAPPYQRPPLSKGLLGGTVSVEQTYLEEPTFFDKHRIQWLAGQHAVAIDRVTKEVELNKEWRLPYSHVVLATGARNRRLPQTISEAPGVLALRTLDDALQLRAHLGRAKRIVVIGAGFIGLEASSIASALGMNVQVIEANSHLMGRVLSVEASQVFQRLHESQGVTFHMNSRIMSIHTDDESGTHRVQLEDGTWLTADVILVAIGVEPNTGLAKSCGLAVGDGIIVDQWLRTTDPDISALGDCAAFPFHLDDGRLLRLESVQNAVDQGRYVAEHILGGAAPYARVPIFWSDQAGSRLQIAGVGRPQDRSVVRRNPGENGMSVFRYRQDQLVSVESINRPADHMLARRLLAARLSPPPSLVADPVADLRQLLATAMSVA